MNQNNIKDKKIKSKKKGKNLKIDLSDTSNTKINKNSKTVENNKSVENNKTNDYINNLTIKDKNNKIRKLSKNVKESLLNYLI